jgi:hypothetical protein
MSNPLSPPYDGKSLGEFIGHGIPRLYGNININGDYDGSGASISGSGIFAGNNAVYWVKPASWNYVDSGGYGNLTFNSSTVIPSTNSVQPGAIAAQLLITY